MRQVRWVVGGVVVMAFTLAGCGESPPESGPVEYKATNSPEIEALTKRMSENAKGMPNTKKQGPAGKPGAAKPSETKSETNAKGEMKKD
jgi:hypothetical protein